MDGVGEGGGTARRSRFGALANFMSYSFLLRVGMRPGANSGLEGLVLFLPAFPKIGKSFLLFSEHRKTVVRSVPVVLPFFRKKTNH
ncbi:MAG: hypothetical protein JJU05_13880 [Verrucomicrobia bacterium]|nr:hypothetical protein [Verrucomicrobiota bacterium]MCH8527988.1 hypothetical protein [Kiritimatiellia bacterium]